MSDITQYIVFDLETTGVDTDKDEIVQLAAVLLDANTGEELDKLKFYCKPSKPIPKEASDVHGITNEMVKNLNPFKSWANQVYKMFDRQLVAGFNSNRFDCVILDRQLKESGITEGLSSCILYDAYKIYQEDAPRDLTHAHIFYTGNTFDDAHDADADVNATKTIIDHQITKDRSLDQIFKSHPEWLPENRVGITNHILVQDGKYILNFGKYSGKPIEKVDKGFLNWILKNDFSVEVKDLVRKYAK